MSGTAPDARRRLPPLGSAPGVGPALGAGMAGTSARMVADLRTIHPAVPRAHPDDRRNENSVEHHGMPEDLLSGAASAASPNRDPTDGRHSGDRTAASTPRKPRPPSCAAAATPPAPPFSAPTSTRSAARAREKPELEQQQESLHELIASVDRALAERGVPRGGAVPGRVAASKIGRAEQPRADSLHDTNLADAPAFRTRGALAAHSHAEAARSGRLDPAAMPATGSRDPHRQ